MARGGERAERGLPPVVLGHLMSLTGDAGIIQHCKLSEPDTRHGYSIDDQARGLIVASHLDRFGKRGDAVRLADVTLDYIERAALPTGGFRNFMSTDGEWLDEIGSEDSFGRTVWGLGVAAASAPKEEHSVRSARLLNSHLARAERVSPPRAVAFCLLGCCEIAHADSAEIEGGREVGVALGKKLLGLFEKNSSGDWPWFEKILAYSNGRLPESLLRGAVAFEEPAWAVAATRALSFLMDVTTVADVFAPIGNDGWYRKGRDRAMFDQQPVDAGSMVDACLAAYDVTAQEKYLEFAFLAMDWYYGKNMAKASVYEPWSGAVFDGLHPDSVNRNQGAESVVTYLMARINIEQYLGAKRAKAAGGTDPG